MKTILAALVCAIVVFFPSSSFAASFACEGTVRTLVALSNRQIWSNVSYKVDKPIVAANKTEAVKSAEVIAVKAMKARETTVAVEHARMRCEEIPDKPKDAPKPLTSVAPVKITYRWVCWVKTTWHLGARSGKIEKRDIPVDTEDPNAKGLAMGKAILQVQERAKALLFGKNDKPTWGQTDVDCEH